MDSKKANFWPVKSWELEKYFLDVCKERLGLGLGVQEFLLRGRFICPGVVSRLFLWESFKKKWLSSKKVEGLG